MAKLVDDDGFSLNLELVSYNVYEIRDLQFKMTPMWKGKPILNESILKRGTSYWNIGKKGGLVGEEIDGFYLLNDLEQCLIDGKPFTYESWPDPDFNISVYPNVCFPEITCSCEDNWAIVFSTDTYQLKGDHCYSGNGIAFYMNVSKEKIKRFTEELRSEYDALVGKK